MKQIKERPDAPLLQTMLLRSMQQAVYSPDNIGHFGLAYEAYAHFTTPDPPLPGPADAPRDQGDPARQEATSRRASSSRQLNTTVSNASAQAGGDKPSGTPAAEAEKDLTIWDALGVHCSANERRADEASRDVEAWLKCYFIKDKLGEEFTGVDVAA